MTKLRCAHCGARFIPAPQVPNQAYCSTANCQKERRRQWHKSKLQSDPDYRDNQSRAQKAWTEKNPDYWRKHRQGRSDYGNRLPSGQDSSAPEPRNPSIKMESSNPSHPLRKALPNLMPSRWTCGLLNFPVSMRVHFLTPFSPKASQTNYWA